MSLINEALKKAQRERETTPSGVGTTPAIPSTPVPPTPPVPPPGAPPSAAPTPGPVPRPSANNRQFTLQIAAAACIVALSVAVTVYFLRGDRSPAPAVVVATPAAAAPGSAVMPAPATDAAVAPVGFPAAAPTATPAPVPTAGPAPIPAVSMAAVIPAEPAPADQAKARLRIQAMVNKFRVTGIRLSPTEAKVILNDKLFRANDVIEESLGLRLVKIEANRLTFSDLEGNAYLKHF